MFQFQSLQTVSIWTAIVVVLFIWFGTLKNPIAVISAFIRTLRTSKAFLIAVIGMLLILLINNVELHLEKLIPVTWDFTPVIYNLEGDFVLSLQKLFSNPYVTRIVGFFYLVVFQALIVSSLGIYVASGQTKLATAVCYAVTLNYLIAIPFYLFVPVNEVWSYSPTGVTFQMLDVFPSFEEQYRQLSGLDNCFPSLHTSISVTVALLALRSGIRRWQWVASISAVVILFSIFYLGIHWLTDMVAGVTLAVFASWAGMRLAGVRASEGSLLQTDTVAQQQYSVDRSS
ncbi:phosphatase PAP2 family protein [Paenibacillus marinisediminis]